MSTQYADKYRLVYVEWEDSYGCSPEWEVLPEKMPEPKRVISCSVGWLVHDGDKVKVIVPHLTKAVHLQGCGDMTIPASAIRKIVNLRRRGVR